jgi:hypothetical protein
VNICASCKLAARESEAQVDAVLRHLIEDQQPLSADGVKDLLARGVREAGPATVSVPAVDLHIYDSLLPSWSQPQAVTS